MFWGLGERRTHKKVYNPQLTDSRGKRYSNGIVRIIVIVLDFVKFALCVCVSIGVT